MYKTPTVVSTGAGAPAPVLFISITAKTMRRLKRIVSWLALTLAAACLIGMLVLWPRGQQIADSITCGDINQGEPICWVIHAQGHTTFWYWHRLLRRPPYEAPFFVRYRNWRFKPGRESFFTSSDDVLFTHLSFAGVEFFSGVVDLSGPGRQQIVLRAPDWSLLLFPLSFIAISVRSIQRERRRANRVRKGQCLHCGYDLRATPGRCPECGRANVPKPQPASA